MGVEIMVGWTPWEEKRLANWIRWPGAMKGKKKT